MWDWPHLIHDTKWHTCLSHQSWSEQQALPQPQTAHARDKVAAEDHKQYELFLLSIHLLISSLVLFWTLFLFSFLAFVLNLFSPVVVLTGALFPECFPQRVGLKKIRTTSDICWGRPPRGGSSSNSTEHRAELLSQLGPNLSKRDSWHVVVFWSRSRSSSWNFSDCSVTE